MIKRISIFLLLVVFMLAQFSVASAATVMGNASMSALPVFSQQTSVNIDWAVTGLTAATNNVLIWSRIQQTPAVNYGNCALIANLNSISSAKGIYTYTLPAVVNGTVLEFIITIDDNDCAGAPTNPVAGDAPMGETTIDSFAPEYFNATPPSITGLPKTIDPVACNTFEYWAMATDHYMFPSTIGYSGIGAWNLQVTGTFAPPAPVGPGEDLLS